ncbi:MAG: hypothetical protein AAF993_22860 [Pseudomonadota bacterium]
MKVVGAFLAAVLATYILAVLFYTQLNLANLVEMGLAVSMGDRLQAAFHDLLGMAVIYLPVIALALLLGFLIARVVLIWVPQLRALGYVVAGFVGIFAIDFLLGATVASGTHGLAVTRTAIGLLSQCIAGAAGGYVFSQLSDPNPSRSYVNRTAA